MPFGLVCYALGRSGPRLRVRRGIYICRVYVSLSVRVRVVRGCIRPERDPAVFEGFDLNKQRERVVEAPRIVVLG